jgi:hypothetical protein
MGRRALALGLLALALALAAGPRGARALQLGVLSRQLRQSIDAHAGAAPAPAPAPAMHAAVGGGAAAAAAPSPSPSLASEFRFMRQRSEAAVGSKPTAFYYDASNMPSWLTPPWVTSAFRTGPLALPLPSRYASEEGPMFMGVPPQPILPFDAQIPTDNVPLSQHFANYPTAAIPSGRMLSPGQAPPQNFLELEQHVLGSAGHPSAQWYEPVYVARLDEDGGAPPADAPRRQLTFSSLRPLRTFIQT